MPDHIREALDLVSFTRNELLIKIKNEYKKSLKSKLIRSKLRIVIKNALENLRSALDYCAREIHSNAVRIPTNQNIYFPIAKKGYNKNDFESLVNKNIPQILKTRPDLVKLIASFQEFADEKNSWLPDLATLTNENKHVQLTPQYRKERKRINVIHKSGLGSVSWDPKSVRFGNGVRIFGVPINTDSQLPRPSKNQEIKIEIWVSFIFEEVDLNVLDFFEECIIGVNNIISKIKEKI